MFMMTIEYRPNQISCEIPAIVLNVDGVDYIIQTDSLNDCLVDPNCKKEFPAIKCEEWRDGFFLKSAYSHVELLYMYQPTKGIDTFGSKKIPYLVI